MAKHDGEMVREEARDVHVLDHVDVLVAGAGVAGCAAATASARAGARTVLTERNGVPGGVATAGLMANIGNRYIDRDGRLVIHGFAKEVVDRGIFFFPHGGGSEWDVVQDAVKAGRFEASRRASSGA